MMQVASAPLSEAVMLAVGCRNPSRTVAIMPLTSRWHLQDRVSRMIERRSYKRRNQYIHLECSTSSYVNQWRDNSKLQLRCIWASCDKNYQCDYHNLSL